MSKKTRSISSIDADEMVRFPNKNANEIGRRAPYYLQYIRDGKPHIKPKEDIKKDGK